MTQITDFSICLFVAYIYNSIYNILKGFIYSIYICVYNISVYCISVYIYIPISSIIYITLYRDMSFLHLLGIRYNKT